MGKNKIKVTGFRISDPNILPKIEIIAKRHKRVRNAEVEWALSDYINRYEQQYGIIELPQNDVTGSEAKINIGNINQTGNNNSINF